MQPTVEQILPSSGAVDVLRDHLQHELVDTWWRGVLGPGAEADEGSLLPWSEHAEGPVPDRLAAERRRIEEGSPRERGERGIGEPVQEQRVGPFEADDELVRGEDLDVDDRCEQFLPRVGASVGIHHGPERVGVGGRGDRGPVVEAVRSQDEPVRQPLVLDDPAVRTGGDDGAVRTDVDESVEQRPHDEFPLGVQRLTGMERARIVEQRDAECRAVGIDHGRCRG